MSAPRPTCSPSSSRPHRATPSCSRGHSWRGHVHSVVGGLLALVAPTQASASDQTATPAPHVERFALVIGNNSTSSPQQAPLRFADDDAARIAEVLREAGTDVELLTTFDRDSQQLFSGLVNQAQQPTTDAVKTAYRRLLSRMRQAKSRGQVELTIYYSGHGDVGPDGRAFLTLDGGRLTKHDLFSGMLAPSPADHNHLLIDACRSEALVLSRGKDWRPDRSSEDLSLGVRQFLERDQLASYPNTGVVLASSADQKTHEWEVYRGGIFTHQLVSGLRGAADLNGDGNVEYSEIGGFVSAANRGVSDPRGRLDVVVRAPAGNQRAALISHDDIGDERVALFVGSDVNHYVIEDHRGVRVADLRRGDAHPTYVRLPDGDIFITRQGQTAGRATRKEAKIDEGNTGAVVVQELAFASPQRASRGPLVDSLRAGLFRVGYGPSYYAGYTAQQNLLGIGEPDWEVRVWKRVDGELVEVTRVSGADGQPPVDSSGPPAGEFPDSEDCDCTDEQLARELESIDEDFDFDEDDDDDWSWDRAWGALSVGPVFTPFAPEGEIRLNPYRITSNQFSGVGDSRFQRAIRGGELRWWFFSAKGHSDYPGAEGYFRTGITQGSADFLPQDEDAPFATDEPVRLEYLTVPLFIGGNAYLFDRFPVRPFLGAGAGFDILRVDYTRHERSNLTDVSARIGFELHAGIDARITNYVGIVAEVRQLWSARRKLPHVPDFSNEGLTIVTAIKFGFPLHPRRGQVNRRSHRGSTRGQTTTVPPGPPMPAPPPVPPEPPVTAPGPVAPEPPVGTAPPVGPESPTPATTPAPNPADDPNSPTEAVEPE
ncbi:MAG: hypothetical protein B7733_15415 [Myxococcales bacterium FL481]|nr:MAG: hypothetical protein B7733_15415 [Myxococcales bacterium FL481]